MGRLNTFTLFYALLDVSLRIVPAFSIGSSEGFASGVTGGGSAAAQTPTSISQLATWLSDSTARVIVLDKIFDFTTSEGTKTGSVCSPWTCSPNPQQAIADSTWCDPYPKTTGTWNVAGKTALRVGSNKTLLGKGSGAGIKGKGLTVNGSKNVIIQNIQITDINERYVWGGDAIDVSGSDLVWIDHNYIARIGRQFIVTHFGTTAPQRVTITNNVFDGRSTYTPGCNGKAYWIMLILGVNDKVTIARNHFFYTSGRGPHAGGTAGNNQLVHIYNNYYNTIDGHALDIGTGAKALAEGNYFKVVTTPITTDTSGAAYVPVKDENLTACSTYIGRNCVINTSLSAGSISRVDLGTLPYFTADKSTMKVPTSASVAAAAVQASAGVGIIN